MVHENEPINKLSGNDLIKEKHTISKRSLTNFSESPLYLEVRIAEEMLKNVVWHSFATAFARRVLPVICYFSKMNILDHINILL